MGKCFKCGRETAREYFYYRAETSVQAGASDPRGVLEEFRKLEPEVTKLEKHSFFYCRRCLWLLPTLGFFAFFAVCAVLYFLLGIGSVPLTVLTAGAAAVSLGAGIYCAVSYAKDRPDDPDSRAAAAISAFHPSVPAAQGNTRWLTPKEAGISGPQDEKKNR